MRGLDTGKPSSRWGNYRLTRYWALPILISSILVISLAGDRFIFQESPGAKAVNNEAYVAPANSRAMQRQGAELRVAARIQNSGDASESTVIEWSGIIIGSLALLVTVLTLGTAIAALFGFSELRKARERAAATQQQMANRLREIEDLAGRWEAAVQEADTRVEAIVQGAYGFNQGQEAYAEGNYQRAVDCFRRANQLQPRSTAILYKLGRSYTNLGDLKNAEETFNTALAIESSCAEAHRGLAIAYRYDDLPRALKSARSAVEADPEDLKNWNCLGLLLRDDGANAESIVAHQHAYLLDDSQRITAFYLALLHGDTKRLAQAGDYIHQATVNLDLDEHYGRIKPLWAAVLRWAQYVFDRDDSKADEWARRAAVACHSVRRVHEVRGHMLFLLTAFGRTSLIDHLPDVLRTPPVPNPRLGDRYDPPSGATNSREGGQSSARRPGEEEGLH